MTTYKTLAEARDMLPNDAEWSCSFGNPGEPQFHEFWRTLTRRYMISNGLWNDTSPYSWSIELLDEVASS